MRYRWDLHDFKNSSLVQSVQNTILNEGDPTDLIGVVIAVMAWNTTAFRAFPTSWQNAFAQLPERAALRYRVFFSGFVYPAHSNVWRVFLKGPVPRVVKRRVVATRRAKLFRKVR